MLFKPELAEKILKGEKSQTRRIVKLGEHFEDYSGLGKAVYKANGQAKWITGKCYSIQPGRGKASIGRFKLLDIRQELVKDISEADAIAEGVETNHYYCDEGTELDPMPTHRCDPVGKFLELFESINGKGSLDKECWVLVLEVVKE